MPARTLQSLHAKYAQVALHDPRQRTPDEDASLIYYRAELALSQGTLGGNFGILVIRWTRTVAHLEAYIEATGKFPRDNRRLPAGSFTAERRQLITWVNRQIRDTALGKRNRYQRERLSLISGYVRTSRPDNWHTALVSYEQFLDSHSGVPSKRSSNAHERYLANWALRQRRALRDGVLSGSQADALRRLRIWGT